MVARAGRVAPNPPSQRVVHALGEGGGQTRGGWLTSSPLGLHVPRRVTPKARERVDRFEGSPDGLRGRG